VAKISVKFTGHWGRYNSGEVAGFEPDVVAKLRGLGVIATTDLPSKTVAKSSGAPDAPDAKPAETTAVVETKRRGRKKKVFG
jgi:hypothetical protein